MCDQVGALTDDARRRWRYNHPFQYAVLWMGGSDDGSEGIEVGALRSECTLPASQTMSFDRIMRIIV